MSEGFQGLYAIVVVLLSIFFVWLLLSEVKWEAFLKNPHSPKARLLQIVIAVILGYLFASFLLQYFNFSTMLQDFVE